jgi:hypothetical protein
MFKVFPRKVGIHLIVKISEPRTGAVCRVHAQDKKKQMTLNDCLQRFYGILPRIRVFVMFKYFYITWLIKLVVL